MLVTHIMLSCCTGLHPMPHGFSQRSPKNRRMTSGPQMCPKRSLARNWTEKGWPPANELKPKGWPRFTVDTGNTSPCGADGGKWARFSCKSDETHAKCVFKKTNFFISEILSFSAVLQPQQPVLRFWLTKKVLSHFTVACVSVLWSKDWIAWV